MSRLHTGLDPCEHNYDVGGRTHRELIEQLLNSLPDYEHKDLLREVLVTVVKLAEQGAARGDVKILRTAVKELRHAFRIFDRYRGIPKVFIFGSARTASDHPNYRMATDFAREIVRQGWMVITGAGPGIMEAGNLGAGRSGSFGLNILLPFEQTANRFIDEDVKLTNFKYFFTRKLFFVKETDAIVVVPGGMGTQDECFESLTLVQTGKDSPCPIVLLEEENGSYWKDWLTFVEGQLVGGSLVSAADRSLLKMTQSVSETVEEILGFYRRFHSLRYVHRRQKVVLRLRRPISDQRLDRLNRDFGDLVVKGSIERCPPFPEERDEPETRDLPRLVFVFNQRGFSRLRQLIDTINQPEGFQGP